MLRLFAMSFGVSCGLGTQGDFVDVISLYGEKPSDKSSETSWQMYHVDTLDDTFESAILAPLRDDPSMQQAEIAERIGKSLPTVKRAMKRLSDSGAVRRVGGRRFGKWEIDCEA